MKMTSGEYDLFDQEGRHASISLEYGGQFSDRQEFTYIRKDLLDRYLAESKQRLAWAVYGERALHHAGLCNHELLDGGPPYVRYGRMLLHS